MPGVLEATAALVAGFSEAEPEAEAIPAWMEGEADTAADNIMLCYRIKATKRRTMSIDGPNVGIFCFDRPAAQPVPRCLRFHDKK